MRQKRIWTVVLVLVLALGLAQLPVRPAYAATITVDTTNDVLDAAGSCGMVTVASLPGTDGVISLREAICAANSSPGADIITFNILGCGGVCTIRPNSALPILSGSGTTIDGYSQAGAAEATDTLPAVLRIQIDGVNAGTGSNGFFIDSANNVIRGLVINRFLWNGIYISGSDAISNTISGNYIGTTWDGTADLGNAFSGVAIESVAQNNTIGGDTAGERNVISGNNEVGVLIDGSGAMSNNVSGNYIGTDETGTADLGNTLSGVHISGGAQNNTIGGDTASERNVISGNNDNGVRIHGSSTVSNTISGNYIGTKATGTAGLANAMHGVYIGDGAQNNTVGPDNLIAYNDLDGVRVNGGTTTNNTITHNSIYSNTMGIDLVSGANGNIAAPVIVTTTQGSVNVVGTACANCTVEVFENSNTDGEGETYVGSSSATNGGLFTVTVSSLSKPYLTATATTASSGRTSEFSAVFTSTVTGGGVYLPIILKND